MRLRANKLLYLPVGGALAAGLLTSVFVLPQTTLAASQDCYGVCSSTTALGVAPSTVSASQERLVDFSVTVGAGTSTNLAAAKTGRGGRGGGGNSSTGTPTGTVSVKTGRQVLCRIHLSHGTGQCSLSNGELRPGSYQVVAQYGGDRNFNPSTSAAERLTVLKATTKTSTALSLSRSTLSSNREWIEEFSVRVNGQSRQSGTPTGSVTVETNGQALCHVHLSHGRGECSLSHQLRPGSYRVVAEFSGDANFSASTSGHEYLTVRR